MNLIFSSALKGAGDTRFVMMMMLCISLSILIIPSILLVVVFKCSIYTLWTIGTIYVCGIGFAFLARYKSGVWKKMKVI